MTQTKGKGQPRSAAGFFSDVCMFLQDFLIENGGGLEEAMGFAGLVFSNDSILSSQSLSSEVSHKVLSRLLRFSL